MRLTVDMGVPGGLLAIGIAGGDGNAFQMHVDGHTARTIVENIRDACASALRDPPPPSGFAPGVEINFLDPETGRGCTVLLDVASWRVFADSLSYAAAICARLSPEVGHA